MVRNTTSALESWEVDLDMLHRGRGAQPRDRVMALKMTIIGHIATDARIELGENNTV